jgi:hypothetical protein
LELGGESLLGEYQDISSRLEEFAECDKKIRDGSPARDYILTGLYANQDQLRTAYGNIPGFFDNYMETIFSDVQKSRKLVRE